MENSQRVVILVAINIAHVMPFSLSLVIAVIRVSVKIYPANSFIYTNQTCDTIKLLFKHNIFQSLRKSSKFCSTFAMKFDYNDEHNMPLIKISIAYSVTRKKKKIILLLLIISRFKFNKKFISIRTMMMRRNSQV